MYDIYVNGKLYLNEIVNLEAAIRVSRNHPDSYVINNATHEVVFMEGE